MFVALVIVVSVSRATSVVPPTFDELVAESEAVIRGIVTDVRAEEFDSPQGPGIRTLVTLRVERALKGSAGETITLVQLGGRVGGRALRVAGLPEFKAGDRQVVFVAGNGRVICPVIAGIFGRFLVQTDVAAAASMFSEMTVRLSYRLIRYPFRWLSASRLDKPWFGHPP